MLGRVANWTVDIREQPDGKSTLIRRARRDELLALIEQIEGDAVMPHNKIWYKTTDGYAYSSWVQPVQDVKNPAEPDKAAGKFWGEITVPFSDSRFAPDPVAGRSNRLYYTGVFRVIEAVKGKDDEWWYRLQDGVTYTPGPYVRAAHVRRFDPSELTPLSPNVTDKHIEVSLKDQTISAYEGNTQVLTARVASGYGGFRTPSGKHTVLFKNPTARMIGGEGSDAYDLPGVPFPTFITWSGVAIHGAYWHNDFGRPRSHGCLNVMADVARWFWRWTAPVAPYEAATYYTPKGAPATTVTVA
jgi:lipoprotein-anchoring transpeptidase ErfK/SrfK